MQIANFLTTTSIKERSDWSSSDPITLPRLIGLLFAAIAVGAIVGLDAYLAPFVDEEYWALMYLHEFPYKVSLVTAVLLCVIGVVIGCAARAKEYRDIQIVLMLISMQLVSIGVGGLDPIDLLTVVFTFLIVAYALANPGNPIKFPLVMYFAVAIGLLDLPYASTDGLGHFIVALIKFGKSAILPLILVHIITNERLVRLFVNTLIVVAFFSACIGILQVIVFTYSGIPLVIVHDYGDALKPTPWGMMLRAHGLNPETHTLLTFLLIALPFSLYSTIRGSSTWHKIFFGVITGTIIMGVVFTWAYGGIIAVCVISGLFPFFIWPHKSIHYLLALLLIPAFLYATDLIVVIYEILRDEASMSTGIWQRKMLNLIALEEIARNPWVGRGFETVQFFSGNYIGRPVHNAYLQTWVATGPIGFIVFTTMMLVFTTSTFILGFSGSGEQEYRFRLITLVLIAFMILMISEPMLFSASTWVLLGFAQALILIYRRKGDNSRPTNSTLEIVGRAHRQQQKKHTDA